MQQTDSNLIELRHTLHRNAELSGNETGTAHIITDFLQSYQPDQLIENVGGHGIAAIFKGQSAGPRVLIRCELDALPIAETVTLPWSSESANASHKCGHDGHMTMVAALAPRLRSKPPSSGSVVLLFQPGEEIGQGAQWVLDDPKFKEIAPDYVFALHNLPGYRRHTIIVRDGVFASASRGLIVRLHGATSHAAEPDRGRSPALAAAQLITSFSAAGQFYTALHESAQVTVIHAKLGERAFGTSPGEAVVMATLRSHSEAIMDRLAERCTTIAERIAATYELGAEIEWVEAFPSTVNDDESVRLVEKCAGTLDLEVVHRDIPFAWSEDFGNFTAQYTGALFGLGSGEEQPALHHPDYDFPDDLLATGTNLFAEIIRELLEN
ncbi:MAG: amidohydrolase [Candidatus Zixiibacteriota bacterium]|jgi:amidohydrolase